MRPKKKDFSDRLRISSEADQSQETLTKIWEKASKDIRRNFEVFEELCKNPQTPITLLLGLIDKCFQIEMKGHFTGTFYIPESYLREMIEVKIEKGEIKEDQWRYIANTKIIVEPFRTKLLNAIKSNPGFTLNLSMEDPALFTKYAKMLKIELQTEEPKTENQLVTELKQKFNRRK